MNTFLNFVQETQKIARLKFDVNSNTHQITTLEQKLVLNNNLFAKQWLLEKIGELRNTEKIN